MQDMKCTLQSRPQVNADQHWATASMPHFSTPHTDKSTRTIHTTSTTALLYSKHPTVMV